MEYNKEAMNGLGRHMEKYTEYRIRCTFSLLYYNKAAYKKQDNRYFHYKVQKAC